MCRKPRNKWSVNHQTIFLKVVLTNQPEGPAGGCSLRSEKKIRVFKAPKVFIFLSSFIDKKAHANVCLFTLSIEIISTKTEYNPKYWE